MALKSIDALLINTVVDLYLIAVGGQVLIIIQDLVIIDLNYLSLGSMSPRPEAFLQSLAQQKSAHRCQCNSC